MDPAEISEEENGHEEYHARRHQLLRAVLDAILHMSSTAVDMDALPPPPASPNTTALTALKLQFLTMAFWGPPRRTYSPLMTVTDVTSRSKQSGMWEDSSDSFDGAGLLAWLSQDDVIVHSFRAAYQPYVIPDDHDYRQRNRTIAVRMRVSSPESPARDLTLVRVRAYITGRLHHKFMQAPVPDDPCYAAVRERFLAYAAQGLEDNGNLVLSYTTCEVTPRPEDTPLEPPSIDTVDPDLNFIPPEWELDLTGEASDFAQELDVLGAPTLAAGPHRLLQFTPVTDTEDGSLPLDYDHLLSRVDVDNGGSYQLTNNGAYKFQFCTTRRRSAGPSALLSRFDPEVLNAAGWTPDDRQIKVDFMHGDGTAESARLAKGCAEIIGMLLAFDDDEDSSAEAAPEEDDKASGSAFMACRPSWSGMRAYRLNHYQVLVRRFSCCYLWSAYVDDSTCAGFQCTLKVIEFTNPMRAWRRLLTTEKVRCRSVILSHAICDRVGWSGTILGTNSSPNLIHWLRPLRMMWKVILMPTIEAHFRSFPRPHFRQTQSLYSACILCSVASDDYSVYIYVLKQRNQIVPRMLIFALNGA